MTSYPLAHSKKPAAKTNRSASSLALQLLDLLLKILALSMTLLGIWAWIAGKSYQYGFWGSAGNGGPLSSSTLQETALTGFISPFKNWLWAVLCIAGFSTLIAVLGIRFQSWPKSNIKNFVFTWLARHFSYDRENGVTALLLLAAAAFLYSFLIYPLGAWVVGSYSAGQDYFTTFSCQARQNPPTTIVLASGASLRGRVLDRSDKMLMLNDGFRIHTIAIGEQSRLVDTTSINISCKKT